MAAGSPNHLIPQMILHGKADPNYPVWEDAWKAFYEYHFPRLAKHIAGQFYQLGWDEAADIAQETLIKFLDHIDEIEPARGVTSFLNKTAFRTALDYLPKKKRLPKATIPEDHTDFSAVKEQKGMEIRDSLEAAMKQLSEKDRILVEKRIFEEKSLQQIADETQTPLATVQAHIAQALHCISRFLQAQ